MIRPRRAVAEAAGRLAAAGVEAGTYEDAMEAFFDTGRFSAP